MKATTSRIPIPEPEGVSQEMAERLATFIGPLLVQLDQHMDRRLVGNFAAALVGLVRNRRQGMSLVLTELGEKLKDGAHAPAGVKRLWRLLRCPNWEAEEIDEWLLEQADAAVERAIERDGVALVDLDGSEVEKPASHHLEGLAKVRSAVAYRLARACGGPPPKVPTIVPGFPWLAVVVCGLQGSLTLARLHWYSPQAPDDPQRQHEAEREVVTPLLARWGQKVLWLADRGYGNAPFLGGVLAAARFLVRWRKDYCLTDVETGQTAKASVLTRKRRSRWTTQFTDPRTKQTWTVGITSLLVTLPEGGRPLWLVVARRKGKSSSIWFLTTEDASTEHGALFVVRAYVRRWQVEWAFRFEKSELGIGSVRVESGTYRQKLWKLAELVHAFLLFLLVDLDPDALARVLRWCHRTGQHARDAIAPLYRLRHALANLWEDHTPSWGWSPPLFSIACLFPC